MRSERQTFSAFVFDLDGTLIDSRPAIEKAAQLAIAAVLPAHQGRCVTDVIGPPIRIMFRRIIGNCDEDTLERLVAARRSMVTSAISRTRRAILPRVTGELADGESV